MKSDQELYEEAMAKFQRPENPTWKSAAFHADPALVDALAEDEAEQKAGTSEDKSEPSS